MKVKPLHDNILVERLEETEKTKGGIIIPDSAKEKPAQGVVVAVGGGRLDEKGKTVPLEVKEGDKVLFRKYAGTEVNIGGDDYLIMSEDDVLAIIEDKGGKSSKSAKK